MCPSGVLPVESHIFYPFFNLWEDIVLMLCAFLSQAQTVIFKSFDRVHLFSKGVGHNTSLGSLRFAN